MVVEPDEQCDTEEGDEKFENDDVNVIHIDNFLMIRRCGKEQVCLTTGCSCKLI